MSQGREKAQYKEGTTTRGRSPLNLSNANLPLGGTIQEKLKTTAYFSFAEF